MSKLFLRLFVICSLGFLSACAASEAAQEDQHHVEGFESKSTNSNPNPSGNASTQAHAAIAPLTH